jgi:hypothetical protein
MKTRKMQIEICPEILVTRYLKSILIINLSISADYNGLDLLCV